MTAPANLQTFKTQLHEVVTAKRLSGSRLQALTEMGMGLMKYDLDLLSLLTHLHSSLPSPSQQRINSLYTLDALLRACRSSVKKGKSTEIGGLEGSCAGFILLVEGWLEELVGGMGRGDSGGVWKEGAEKMKKVLGFWREGAIFPPDVLDARETQLSALASGPSATSSSSASAVTRPAASAPASASRSLPPSELASSSSRPADSRHPSQSRSPTVPSPPPPGSTSTPASAGVPAGLLALLQGVSGGGGSAVPSAPSTSAALLPLQASQAGHSWTSTSSIPNPISQLQHHHSQPNPPASLPLSNSQPQPLSASDAAALALLDALQAGKLPPGLDPALASLIQEAMNLPPLPPPATNTSLVTGGASPFAPPSSSSSLVPSSSHHPLDTPPWVSHPSASPHHAQPTPAAGSTSAHQQPPRPSSVPYPNSQPVYNSARLVPPLQHQPSKFSSQVNDRAPSFPPQQPHQPNQPFPPVPPNREPARPMPLFPPDRSVPFSSGGHQRHPSSGAGSPPYEARSTHDGGVRDVRSGLQRSPDNGSSRGGRAGWEGSSSGRGRGEYEAASYGGEDRKATERDGPETSSRRGRGGYQYGGDERGRGGYEGNGRERSEFGERGGYASGGVGRGGYERTSGGERGGYGGRGRGGDGTAGRGGGWAGPGMEGRGTDGRREAQIGKLQAEGGEKLDEFGRPLRAGSVDEEDEGKDEEERNRSWRRKRRDEGEDGRGEGGVGQPNAHENGEGKEQDGEKPEKRIRLADEGRLAGKQLGSAVETSSDHSHPPSHQHTRSTSSTSSSSWSRPDPLPPLPSSAEYSSRR